MDNQTSDTGSLNVMNIDLPESTPTAESAPLPVRVPGEWLDEAAGPPPIEVQSEALSDYDLLNQRVDDLQSQLSAMREQNNQALQYLCQNMGWLVNMLSGVAQLAQNMPGMGGMMAKMLKGGK